MQFCDFHDAWEEKKCQAELLLPGCMEWAIGKWLWTGLGFCAAAVPGFVWDALRVLETLILSPETCCSGLCHARPQCLHRLELNAGKGGREINILPSRGTFESRWGGAILKLRLRDVYFCPSARQTQLMVCIVQTILLTKFLKRGTKTSRKSP